MKASIIQQYIDNFKVLGKIKSYQVKLYSHKNVKPVAVSPRTIPYHLWARFVESVDNLIKHGVDE